MNSRRRIMAAVAHEPSDRAAVLPQVFGHAAVVAGIPLDDYLLCGESLARAQLHALAHYGYDAVFAFMDVCVETEALGSRLRYRRGQYPTVAQHALGSDSDPAAIGPPDPDRDGRMPELLRAIRLLRDQLADRVPVIGCVLGPMTLATQLLGAEKALYLAIDHPEQFSRLLERCADVAIRFGAAQIDAGADLPVVFDPASSPDVIPPSFFRELVQPPLKRLLSGLKTAGAAFNWLSIAGPTLPILAFYPELGVELANIDYQVDPAAARQRLGQVAISGNLRPLAFTEQTPAAIETAARQLLRDHGCQPGFILASGCEIPPEAQPGCIAAMVTAASQAPH
jgi:uroporphyrinogen decarboxylase